MKKRTRTPGLLAHAVVALSTALIVLRLLDLFHPMMGFGDSLYTRLVEALLLLAALALGVSSAEKERRIARTDAAPPARASFGALGPLSRDPGGRR
jgi:hypothetical protein